MVGSAGFLESQEFWRGSICIANFVMSAKTRKGGGQPCYSIIFAHIVSSSEPIFPTPLFGSLTPKFLCRVKLAPGRKGVTESTPAFLAA